MSRRQAILAAFISRLSGILIADGYQTDVGQVVFIGERPVLGPDDPDASIDVVVGADEPGYQGENVFVALPVTVRAVVKATRDSAWATVEAAVSDIKTAIETDHDLGGLLVARGLERGTVEPRDREPGDVVVGVGIRYTLKYVEKWGAP